jgi:hypothetical protein
LKFTVRLGKFAYSQGDRLSLSKGIKMKFFVPGAKDPQKAEEIYKGIKEFNSSKVRISSRRIFAIHYVRNNKPEYVEVGKLLPTTEDIVLAILETDYVYYVCTLSRGGGSGEPVSVARPDISKVINFES